MALLMQISLIYSLSLDTIQVVMASIVEQNPPVIIYIVSRAI